MTLGGKSLTQPLDWAPTEHVFWVRGCFCVSCPLFSFRCVFSASISLGFLFLFDVPFIFQFPVRIFVVSLPVKTYIYNIIYIYDIHIVYIYIYTNRIIYIYMHTIICIYIYTIIYSIEKLDHLVSGFCSNFTYLMSLLRSCRVGNAL